MKTYIFITRRICKIGGAEQYIYNKTKYLEENGWRVLIFSGRRGPILIKTFEKYGKYIYPALYYSPSSYRRREVLSLIDKIVNIVGKTNGSNCIIESDAFQRAVWAELIAKRLNCRHLAFLLQEKHLYDVEMRNFLRFKYNRHELAGITYNSVGDMLSDNNVEKRDDMKISAYCNNVIEDSEDYYSSLLDEKGDINLGYFGRLEKPCVPKIIEGFCSYANLHSNKRFNVVIIGGSSVKGKEENIRKKVSCCSNVNLVMTGNVYPLPLTFVKTIDVFVSTAGAAYATYIAGIPTVLVNPLNGNLVGVIGLDFMVKEKTMYDSNSEIKIEDSIDKVLNNRDKIVYEWGFGEEYHKRMLVEFERQLSFINGVDTNEYYDENLLMKLKTPHTSSHFKYWLIGHIFGSRGLEVIRELIGKAK